MAYEYKKYGATTDGYRGDRAILDERVIEGFDTPTFTSSVLKLTAESAQTIHLTNDNVTSDSHYIVLPDATTLPKNWRITIINDSDYKCAIYRNNISDQELLFFKEVSKGNMTTCILLGNDDIPGEWTTLRTVEEISTDDLDKFTTDVLDSIKINYTQLLEDDSSATIRLSNILTGTALKSIYVKTDINFEGAASAKLSIGTTDDHTKFLANYDLLAAVSDNTFSKDYFNEILSINEDKVVYAYITGSSLSSLISGEVTIVIEKAETVDPTILSNPIIQSQIPLGIIMNYAFDDVPEGFWRLDGTVIPNAQAAIPKFVEKLIEVNNRLPGEKIIVGIDQWNSIYNTYGSCGKFAWSGTGLKFPSINCFVKGIDLTNISQLSGITEAGLPNITGNFHLSTNAGNTGLLGYTQGTGSFRANETSVADYIAQRSTSSSTGNRGWNFDASRSSNIFGKSSTVTPLHVKYPYIISIYHKIQDSAEIVLDQIIEDSVYKANVNLDNLSPAGEAKFVNKANVNLDNLSPEGEAKFVNTTGDTMTGDLTITTPDSAGAKIDLVLSKNYETSNIYTPFIEAKTGANSDKTLSRIGFRQFSNTGEDFWVQAYNPDTNTNLGTALRAGSENSVMFAQAVNPQADSNSADIATTYWSRSQLVQKTGSTMTGRLLINSEGDHFTAKDPNLDRSATTSTNKTGGYFSITDNNNRLIGRLYAGQTDAGYNVVGIHTISDTSTDVQSHLRILVKQDGTRAFASAPTPPNDSNGDMIATTGWSRKQLVGFADTARASSRTLGTLYTAQENGVVIASAWGGKRNKISLYINTTVQLRLTYSQESDWDSCGSTIVYPVSVGDTYKLNLDDAGNNDYSITTYIFCPCKRV